MGLKLSNEYCSKNVDLTLYKSMVGSLMYLTATRPNIMYVVGLISKFMETPKETHWQAAKRILRYVNGTKENGVVYSKTYDFKLIVTLTVIEMEVLMTERAHQGMFFIWDWEPFHGLPRSNQ